MHIYDKQCEIIQKKTMEKLKLPDSVFLQGDVGSSVLKTQKNTRYSIFSNNKTHPGLHYVEACPGLSKNV